MMFNFGNLLCVVFLPQRVILFYDTNVIELFVAKVSKFNTSQIELPTLFGPLKSRKGLESNQNASLTRKISCDL